MGDVALNKKLKLANTKKRFKELQELKKKRQGGPESINQDSHESVNSISAQSSSRNTPVELEPLKEVPISDSEAKSSILNIAQNIDFKEELPSVNYFQSDAEIKETPSLPNYFGSSTGDPPTAFFDNITQNETDPLVEQTVQADDSSTLLTYFNTNENNLEEADNENIGLPKYFDYISKSDAIWENTVAENMPCNTDYKLFPKNDVKKMSPQQTKSEDALCQDYPEIVQSVAQISEHSSRNVDNLSLGSFRVAQYQEPDIFSPSNNQKLMDYLDTTGATEEEKNKICTINQEIDNSTYLTKKEIQQSNLESLKQLSKQLAQIIEPSYDYSSAGTITDLEKRNIDLVSNLEQEKLLSEQLQAISSQLQVRISDLETQLVQKQLEPDLLLNQEAAKLKNELQAHLQTIGLLVAEKTELLSNLNQYELGFKQKVVECEELQARLKASRSRVADLERDLNGLKMEKAKSEAAEKQYNTHLERLNQDYNLLKDNKEELEQDLLEVREKLKKTLEENVKMLQENKNLSGKLSLAEIKIQQLCSEDSLGVDGQVEQLTQEKFSLESEIEKLNQTLKIVSKDRDHYQQYALQVTGEMTNLSNKLEQCHKEKDNLIIQDCERIKHIGELEKQLQNLQSDQVNYATRNMSDMDIRHELEKSKEMCVQLQIEKTLVDENFTKALNEKELLNKELEAKTDSIQELESIIEQLRGNQPDSVKLLAAMESDKVAASRAIEQNKELKQQLESMQEVFHKMDNDKVVLTENFKAQQQTNKDLIDKLQKTEVSLQSLADAIEIKDQELTRLREASKEITKQAIQHEQLEDRLRHYEAHDNSAPILQKELLEAKQTIAKLTNQLNEKNNQMVENGLAKNQLEDSKKTISGLVNEITQLKAIYSSKDQEHNNFNTEVDINSSNTIDTNDNLLNKENVMKCLEEKVKRTMQEIADLTEEKQRLEHIVLQLQGETETIGEYVALYQHQRMVLKQRALEKDQQLKQLANDREQIKIKLEKLDQLIQKLVTEKINVPTDCLYHEESANGQNGSNLGEEHAKLKQDILENSHNGAGDEGDKLSQTVGEITSILSEIKTSNLVEPDENYHYCPWCSGELMTV